MKIYAETQTPLADIISGSAIKVVSLRCEDGVDYTSVVHQDQTFRTPEELAAFLTVRLARDVMIDIRS